MMDRRHWCVESVRYYLARRFVVMPERWAVAADVEAAGGDVGPGEPPPAQEEDLGLAGRQRDERRPPPLRPGFGNGEV